MFGSIGPLELLLIFVVILLVFGSDKLPDLARTIGKSVRKIKKATDDVKKEFLLDADLNFDLNRPTEEEARNAEAAYQSEAAKPIDSPPVTAATTDASSSTDSAAQSIADATPVDSPATSTPKPKKSRQPSRTKAKQIDAKTNVSQPGHSPKSPLLG